MPLPAAALIAAGATLGSQGANAAFTSGNNKKARAWNEHMYKWQRADALADWKMQNEYNSPAAQMQRFRDAGLNPNLIYGQMQDAGAVRSTDSKSWNPEAPQVDIGGAVGEYQRVRMQQSQMDMVEQMLKNKETERQLNIIRAANVSADTAGKLLDNYESNMTMGEKIALKQGQLQAQNAATSKIMAEIGNIGANTDFTMDENTRKWAMHKGNLEQQLVSIAEAKARTTNMRQSTLESKARTEGIRTENYYKDTREINANAETLQRIKNLQKDGTLKDYEIELNKQGFTKNDPYYWRQVEKLYSRIGGANSPEHAKEIIEQMKRELKKTPARGRRNRD